METRDSHRLILVVDDDGDQLDTICRGLFHLGWRCVPARGLDEARAILRARDVALVVVDASAPGKPAWRVVLAARAATPTPPVLAVTGLALTADAIALRAAGVPLLRKPFSPDELGRAVEAALSSNHHHGE